MSIQNESAIVVNPYLYKYGLVASNNATTPNTQIDISAGACRDSQNTIDMSIGSIFPPSNQGAAVTAPITINAAVNGVNGLDTGSLTASKMYAIYMIGDSRGYNATGCILSLATNSAPTLPAGYDSYRIISYWATDASVHFLKGYFTGNQGLLIFKYDAPQVTSVTTGAATSYTGIDLAKWVPPVNNTLVNVQYGFNANAATNTLNLQGYAATGDAILVVATVAGGTAVTYGYADVDAQLNVSNVPIISYRLSTASAAVAINVAGYTVAV